MNIIFNIIVVVQVLSALVIISLVLIQHGKGADMGAAFGSGASGSLFGATGSSNFLSKSTGFAAGAFFIATLALVYLGSHRVAVSGGVMENLPSASGGAASVKQSAPAAAASTNSASTVTTTGQSNQIPK